MSNIINLSKNRDPAQDDARPAGYIRRVSGRYIRAGCFHLSLQIPASAARPELKGGRGMKHITGETAHSAERLYSLALTIETAMTEGHSTCKEHFRALSILTDLLGDHAREQKSLAWGGIGMSNTYYHPFPPECRRFAWIEIDGDRYVNTNYDGDPDDLLVFIGAELQELVNRKGCDTHAKT